MKNNYLARCTAVLALVVFFGAGSINAQADVSSINYTVTKTINPIEAWNNADNLVLLQFRYSRFNTPLSELFGENAATAALEDVPLVYPNPFKLSQGAHIGYSLTQAMDIEIRIYNMRAQEIFRTFLAANTEHTMPAPAYNKFPLNYDTFGNYPLSAGVYFFVLINNGKVIGKGKFALRPE